MKNNFKQNTNIATVLVLAAMAYIVSPEAGTQLLAFTTLLTVVFGRDFLLRKSLNKAAA